MAASPTPHAITPGPRHGVLAGGNWVVDHVKLLDVWPEEEALAHVLSHTIGSGGAPYNVLKDLARLQAPFPLAAAGRLGRDANGEAILADCRAHGIDTRQLRTDEAQHTAYTDVMTVRQTGRRTFFYHSGANARLTGEDFDFSCTAARHFHLGYLLLLDRLDALEEGRPLSAKLLARAHAAGLTTSVDCVSESSDRFQSLVTPVLPEVDVFFANDFEAGRIFGRPLRTATGIDRTATEAAANSFVGSGVRSWVVIHFPEAAYALDRNGAGHWVPSLRIEASEIINSAGAGDALAAGVLFGWHEGWSLSASLELGTACAATSLLDITCSNGVRPLADTLAFARTRGRRDLSFSSQP